MSRTSSATRRGVIAPAPTPSATCRDSSRWPRPSGQRLNIDATGATLKVYGYGKCSPSDCDWGERSGAFAADPFKITFVFANNAPTENLTISFTDDTRTHLKVVAVSTGGTHTYTFHRKYLILPPVVVINPVIVGP